MRKLPIPNHTAHGVYKTCISRARPELQVRLVAHTPKVIEAAVEFESAVQNRTLHTLPTQTLESYDVTKSELVKVYTDRMAKLNGPGRHIYDEIRSAPPSGVCPLCAHRFVDSLDHHLPKELFPNLSVVPSNLIPSCSACNKVKLTTVPLDADHETFHPYFDNFEDGKWLFADILEEIPPAFIFEIRTPDNWRQNKSYRLANHFKTFDLYQFYANLAGSRITHLRQTIIRLFTNGGETDLRTYFRELAEDLSVEYPNSWECATYEALAENDWFCNGGFVPVDEIRR